jgi:hypothetical protein
MGRSWLPYTFARLFSAFSYSSKVASKREYLRKDVCVLKR